MYNPNEIETIVTVQYRTPDGEIYNTIAEALGYRQLTKPGYTAWKEDPEKGIAPTDDLESCAFVHLPDEKALDDFLAEMEVIGCTTDGITETGWYEWYSECWEWRPLSSAVEEIFKILQSKD